MAISLHEEFASISPFGGPDKKTSFRPERVAIETLEGSLLSERLNPRDHFLGRDLDTKWDPLDRAYFNGYAMWVYLNAPFMFNLPGFRTEEIAPIQEKGEKWLGLRVTFPSSFASHSTVQEFHFGNDFLLRRQDYTLDVAGGNYALDVAHYDGLLIPTKRRAYLCDNNYRVLYDRLFIWIDIFRHPLRSNARSSAARFMPKLVWNWACACDHASRTACRRFRSTSVTGHIASFRGRSEFRSLSEQSGQ